MELLATCSAAIMSLLKCRFPLIPGQSMKPADIWNKSTHGGYEFCVQLFQDIRFSFSLQECFPNSVFPGRKGINSPFQTKAVWQGILALSEDLRESPPFSGSWLAFLSKLPQLPQVWEYTPPKTIKTSIESNSLKYYVQMMLKSPYLSVSFIKLKS